MEITTQRARSDEEKTARADAILRAARELCGAEPFARVNVADIARAAGVAKGTVFLYFPTKEAIGLALVERLLGEWMDDLDAALDALAPPASPRDVADAVVRTVAEHPLLVQLLSILGSILEHNVTVDAARGFKRALLLRVRPTGARLERVLPFLGEGGGFPFLMTLNALVIGLHQMAGTAPAVRQVLSEPELAPFRVDFAAALRRAVEVQLEGVRRLGP